MYFVVVIIYFADDVVPIDIQFFLCGFAHPGIAFGVCHDVHDCAGVAVLVGRGDIAIHACLHCRRSAGALDKDGGSALAGRLYLHQRIGIVKRREQEEFCPGIEVFQHFPAGDQPAHYHFLLEPLLLHHGCKLLLILPPAREEHTEVLQPHGLGLCKGADGEVDVLEEVDTAHEEEDGGVRRNAVGLVHYTRRLRLVRHGLVVGGIEAHLAGSREAVFVHIEVLDTAVHGPALVAGVEHSHDGRHHGVERRFETERPFKILPVLGMQRSHHRKTVEFGVDQPCQTDCERRMDMHHVYSTRYQFGLENRVQRRRGDVIIVLDHREGRTAHNLVGQARVILIVRSPGLGAENHHVAVVEQAPGVIVHHFYHPVHHGIPGIDE